MTISTRIALIIGGKVYKEERESRCRLSEGVNDRDIANALSEAGLVMEVGVSERFRPGVLGGPRRSSNLAASREITRMPWMLI